MQIHQSRTIAPEFERIFNLPLNDYIDRTLLATGQAILDIVKLDDRLKADNPDAYTDDLSMQEFVEEKYGHRAVEMIMELIS